MRGNGRSGPRNWAWPGCYCCSPWPAPLRLPRLRQRLGYLPVLRLQMALPRPPGRRLLQRLGYLPVLRLQMALPRPPGRQLLQRLGYLPVLRLQMALPRPPGTVKRLPVHPKPRLKEPGKTKPRTTIQRTLPNPSREAAGPVVTARRRPARETAEPAATTRLLPYRIRAS